jgi:O-antigen ligase
VPPLCPRVSHRAPVRPPRDRGTSYNASVLTFGVVASVLVMVATWWHRLAGVLLVLAALPWAVHHPSGPRTMLLVAVVACLQVAYLVRLTLDHRRQPSPGAPWPALLWATGLWVVAAVLSLLNLPWTSMLALAETFHGAEPGRTWGDVALAWWAAPDDLPHFSTVAAVMTLQAGVLAWMVWREVRQSPEAGVQVALAQVVGLSVTVLLGLVEATGVDLEWLRGYVLVHWAPGSIQSVTGNRGWFSQYVVYALPYSVVLMRGLSVPMARRVLVALSGATLICLLFAFQRGGWAVGAWSVACLLVVLRSAPVDTAEAARVVCRRALRVLATTATVVVLAVVAVRTLVPPPDDRDGLPHVLGDRLSLASYVSRLQGVDLLGGRERYWPVAWDLWKVHPLLGGGVDGFAHQHRVMVAAPDGVLHGRRPRVPMPNSAHNLYLQTLVGTGLAGLLALLAMCGLGLRAMLRTATHETTSYAGRLVAFASGGSLLAIMLYGMVQEVTYIHALRLMLCCAIGLLAAGEGAAERRG